MPPPPWILEGLNENSREVIGPAQGADTWVSECPGAAGMQYYNKVYCLR